MIEANCKKMISELAKAYPNAKTELNYGNPFQLLIAVIMSAQSLDKMVNLVTSDLFKDITSPDDVISLGYDGLSQSMKKLGLWRSKAKNILATSEILIKKHSSSLPEKYEDLLSLPGVGRKTANVVMNTLYNLPYIAVDTHVFRVANRTSLAIGNNPLEVENDFYKKYCAEDLIYLHHRLVLHGRYICKSRKPLCSNCVLNRYCLFYASR